MKYTENDLNLYHELLHSSKDLLCFKLPNNVTRMDLERLKSIGLCDQMPDGTIILCYNDLELEELQIQFQKEQKERNEEKKKAAFQKFEKLLEVFISSLGGRFSTLWKALKSILPF